MKKENKFQHEFEQDPYTEGLRRQQQRYAKDAAQLDERYNRHFTSITIP